MWPINTGTLKGPLKSILSHVGLIFSFIRGSPYGADGRIDSGLPCLTQQSVPDRAIHDRTAGLAWLDLAGSVCGEYLPKGGINPGWAGSSEIGAWMLAESTALKRKITCLEKDQIAHLLSREVAWHND